MPDIPMNTIIVNETDYTPHDAAPVFTCPSSPIQIRLDNSSLALHKASRSGSSASSDIDQFLSAETTPKMPFILPSNHQRIRKPAHKDQVQQKIPLDKQQVTASREEPRSVISLYIKDQSPQEKLFRLRQLARKKQKMQNEQLDRNIASSSSKRKPAGPSEIYSFIPITSW